MIWVPYWLYFSNNENYGIDKVINREEEKKTFTIHDYMMKFYLYIYIFIYKMKK